MQHYCPNKFEYLQIDVEKRLLYNCHNALPEKIKTSWIENNPGKIFNTDSMVQERKQMLRGERNKACDFACYPTEDKGGTSERMKVLEHNKAIYTDPISKIKTLAINCSTNCNLSCTYCSGFFSSTWRNTVKEHGTFADLGKNWHDVFDKVSEKQKMKTPFVDTLVREVERMNSLEQVFFVGGEPILSNYLDLFLDALDIEKTKIYITTGLGVGENRFKRLLEKFKSIKNLELQISAEDLGEYYEYNRYNNTYEKFTNYINLIREHDIKFTFITTVCNLTLFGLHDFYKKFNSETKIGYNYLDKPDFLQKFVLDNESKKVLQDTWSKHNDSYSDKILNGLEYEPTEHQRKMCRLYMTQLKDRRNQSYDIFPESFLKWLELK